MTEDEEWRAVQDALVDAGVDPTDLARFVNHPHPEIPGFEPENFDAKRALPVLLEWLPRASAPKVRDTLASRIRQAGKSSTSARVLIAAYQENPSWQLGDAIARTMTPADHAAVVELAADRTAGANRQMLVDALWRIKTDRARSVTLASLDDPDVSRHAIYSLRRSADRQEVIRQLDGLRDHPNDHVRAAARDALKRMTRGQA